MFAVATLSHKTTVLWTIIPEIASNKGSSMENNLCNNQLNTGERNGILNYIDNDLLAECPQSKPVRATNIHLADIDYVHSNQDR